MCVRVSVRMCARVSECVYARAGARVCVCVCVCVCARARAWQPGSGGRATGGGGRATLRPGLPSSFPPPAASWVRHLPPGPQPAGEAAAAAAPAADRARRRAHAEGAGEGRPVAPGGGGGGRRAGCRPSGGGGRSADRIWQGDGRINEASRAARVQLPERRRV